MSASNLNDRCVVSLISDLIMERLKLIRRLLILSAAGIVVLIAVVAPSSLALERTGRVRGTVRFVNGSAVQNAKVRVKGSTGTFEAITNQHGVYEIEAPVGVYNIIVRQSGLCGSRRASFRIEPKTVANFDFNLVVCPGIDFAECKEETRYAGVECDTVGPFKYDSYTFTGNLTSPLDLLIRYGEKIENNGLTEYKGASVKWIDTDENLEKAQREKYLAVTLSYNLMTVNADKVSFDSKNRILKAEGNLVVENNGPPIPAKRAEIRLGKERPIITLTY